MRPSEVSTCGRLGCAEAVPWASPTTTTILLPPRRHLGSSGFSCPCLCSGVCSCWWLLGPVFSERSLLLWDGALACVVAVMALFLLCILSIRPLTAEHGDSPNKQHKEPLCGPPAGFLAASAHMAQGPRSYPGPSPEQDKGSFSGPSCCPRRGCGCDSPPQGLRGASEGKGCVVARGGPGQLPNPDCYSLKSH